MMIEKEIDEAVQKACILAWHRTAEEPDLGIDECLKRELGFGCEVDCFALNKGGNIDFEKYSEKRVMGNESFCVGDEGVFINFKEDSYKIKKILGHPPILERILNIFEMWKDIEKAKNERIKKILDVWNLRENFFGQTFEAKRIIFSLIPKNDQ